MRRSRTTTSSNCSGKRLDVRSGDRRDETKTQRQEAAPPRDHPGSPELRTLRAMDSHRLTGGPMTTRHKIRRRKERATSLQVASPSFHYGERIPVWHTILGGNESPELSWSDLPAETIALAILCEDPDAAGQDPFVHLLVANVPPHQPGDGLPRALGELPGSLLGPNH